MHFSKFILLNEKCCIFIQISMKLGHKAPSNQWHANICSDNVLLLTKWQDINYLNQLRPRVTPASIIQWIITHRPNVIGPTWYSWIVYTTNICLATCLGQYSITTQSGYNISHKICRSRGWFVLFGLNYSSQWSQVHYCPHIFFRVASLGVLPWLWINP